MIGLSAEEQGLIDWAKRNFGEEMLTFLLAGFGRRESEDFPAFLIDSETQLGYKREIITFENQVDGKLPLGREPLVLLGLLNTLIDLEHDETGQLPFPAYQLFSELNWKESGENYRLLESAVSKYFNMTVTIIEDLGLARLDEPTAGRITLHRFITSYQGNIDLGGKIDLDEYTYSRIDFSNQSVRELRQRKMFEIDWSRVVFITPGTFESFWNQAS